MTERLRITGNAVEEAKLLGFNGNIEKSLQNLYKFSAPFSHQKGTRRNENFVLDVVDGVLLGVDIIDRKKIRKLQFGKTKVCPDCNNDGDHGGYCLSCSSTGYKSKKIKR